MPYEDKESYTIDEMADYLANESMSGEALLDTLSKHGFELREKKGESCGSEMVEEEMIEEEPTEPPVSDDLAVNYLQNPFYLYSGQGNLYQPYGYAGNTLVDLLRTRNLTQPQQAAANLGLFGNPGDFS